MKFSCDLVLQAKSHVVFLQTLHANDVTTRKPSIESFHRYSSLWLPLVHKHATTNTTTTTTTTTTITTNTDVEQEVTINEQNENQNLLIPPADIAWLWHCHRLAPYRYTKHVQHEFLDMSRDEQKVALKTSENLALIDADYPFVVQLESSKTNDEVDGTDDNPTFDASKHQAAADYTKKLWEEMYPNEPFFLCRPPKEEQSVQSLNTNEEKFERENDNSLLLSGFDLLESCVRQAAFLYQVSQINLDDETFMSQGVDNYYKFVSLMKKGVTDRPRFLVPTYQIDLMWHTHILTSIPKYHEDCVRMTQSILEHDDSLTDREEGGILDTNFQATKTLWFEKFNVNYYVQGGMYRGEPPADFYTAEWVHSSSKTKNHNDKVAVGAGDRYMITISKLIENNDWDGVFMYSQQVGLHHHVVNNGASSVGRDEESSLTWKSIDYPDSFIAPVAKTIGVNANIKKDDYVFGNGAKGLGYYHIHTREAYAIILSRMEGKRKIAKYKLCLTLASCLIGVFVPVPVLYSGLDMDLGLALPVGLGIGFVIAFGAGYYCYRQKMGDIRYLNDLIEVTSLRTKAAGPSSDIDIPKELLDRMDMHNKKRGTSSTDSRTHGADGSSGYYWYSDPSYYNEAAACGAGDPGGGGCGGGAAGCGGGDGGGGGCGGGGCGGGCGG